MKSLRFVDKRVVGEFITVCWIGQVTVISTTETTETCRQTQIVTTSQTVSNGEFKRFKFIPNKLF